MKFRPLVSFLIAAVLAALLIHYSPTLHDLDPELFRAENCQRCAHIIVFFALILEAIAIWLHASREEKSGLLKLVAGMFCFSGVLGLGSIALEMISTALPIS